MTVTGRKRVRTVLVLWTILIITAALSQAFAEDFCISCHEDEKFRVQNKALFEYFNNWSDSTHHLAGVSCSDCHGGDPSRSDKTKAHGDNFSSLTSVDRDAYKKIPDRCGKCHQEIFKSFVGSKHFEALLEQGTGPHCSTCHGSMNVKVYYTSIISRTCSECHNEYTRIHPRVVGEADKILHRINVSHALRNWVLINYPDKEPAEVMEVLGLYRNVADSWHTFNFVDLDEKSQELLNKLKSLVNRGLAAKREKTKSQ